jgi:predicted TIM-barrel fold metal-dependent hydrolase
MISETVTAPPEHNLTGQDFADRRHLPHAGPILDVHAHVMTTRPTDPPTGPPVTGPGGTTEQAALMLEVGRDFGVPFTLTMCPADDIPALRERFGRALAFNGMLSKKPDEPDDAAYRNLDRFLELGVAALKLWSAPRGRDRGLVVDAPWRVECLRRARAAGVRVIMVHVGDPDLWWRTTYADISRYGSKEDQYPPFWRLIEMFPEFHWIGAHMGGDPEHPDRLEAMLERFPNLSFDTSATKWQVREVSRRRDDVRGLVCRHPARFLFGTDLVTRHGLTAEHYASRYWCQRTLWESDWQGTSPIADPDATLADGVASPPLRGLGLPADVLRRVYRENAERLFGPVA